MTGAELVVLLLVAFGVGFLLGFAAARSGR